MTSADSHGRADSAGIPWEGRHFEETAFPDDDGSAPPQLAAALASFRAGESDMVSVIDAVRNSRLLIPLVAALGEQGTGDRGLGDHGPIIDKSADLAIVTVAGPDGRSVMPVFTSVDSMKAWNPDARPVPTDAIRVALAAAAEHTDLVVVDPASATEFVIRRPALWAIAQSQPWGASHLDPDVLAAFAGSVIDVQAVIALDLIAGDPTARLAGPETVVRLTLGAGLGDEDLAALLGRLQERWSANEVIATMVDSLAVTLERAPR